MIPSVFMIMLFCITINPVMVALIDCTIKEIVFSCWGVQNIGLVNINDIDVNWTSVQDLFSIKRISRFNLPMNSEHERCSAWNPTGRKSPVKASPDDKTISNVCNACIVWEEIVSWRDDTAFPKILALEKTAAEKSFLVNSETLKFS